MKANQTFKTKHHWCLHFAKRGARTTIKRKEANHQNTRVEMFSTTRLYNFGKIGWSAMSSFRSTYYSDSRLAAAKHCYSKANFYCSTKHNLVFFVLLHDPGAGVTNHCSLCGIWEIHTKLCMSLESFSHVWLARWSSDPLHKIINVHLISKY